MMNTAKVTWDDIHASHVMLPAGIMRIIVAKHDLQYAGIRQSNLYSNLGGV
jgi:hypothetical protein